MPAGAEKGIARDPRRTALVRLGEALRAQGYSFVTPTPETHRRVNSRPSNAEARTLRDVFGWSRPFRRLQVPAPIFDLCSQAQVLVPAADDGERWTSAVRYSTLAGPTGELMFVHSAFPTDGGRTTKSTDVVRGIALERLLAHRRTEEIGRFTMFATPSSGRRIDVHPADRIAQCRGKCRCVRPLDVERDATVVERRTFFFDLAHDRNLVTNPSVARRAGPIASRRRVLIRLAFNSRPSGRLAGPPTVAWLLDAG